LQLTTTAKYPRGKGTWNGRQIRNAFTVAAGLAREQAELEQNKCKTCQPQSRYEHFHEVECMIELYAGFRARVLGGDDSRKARLNEERDDDYVHTLFLLVPHRIPRHPNSASMVPPSLVPLKLRP